MDDRLERARRELRAAERDFDRSVRWLAWSLALVVLSFGNLLAARLHWLPPGIGVPLAVLVGLLSVALLVPVVRWMWTHRPRRRKTG